MKSLKIWSLVALIALAMTACNKKPGPGGEDPKVGGFDKIEQEWKLSTVNGVPADFNIYISFVDGVFALYQQAYTLDFHFYEGEYSISGNTLSGSYFDGTAWKSDYTGGISEDGNTMTLKSTESTPVTYVYVACQIPDSVIEEATATRANSAIAPIL